MRERLARQLESELARRPVRTIELREHRVVVGGRDDDQHVLEVLGRGANQARPADVDLFDQRLERRRRVRGGLHERIEIDDDEVDQGDPVCGGRFEIVGVCPRRARMPPCTRGCSVLTRPSIISGKPVTSEIGSRAVPRIRARAPCRRWRQLEAAVGKSAGELDEAGLIGNAQKRSGHDGIVHTLAQISVGTPH